MTYVGIWSRRPFGKADCSRRWVWKQKSLEIAAVVCSGGGVCKCELLGVLGAVFPQGAACGSPRCAVSADALDRKKPRGFEHVW